MKTILWYAGNSSVSYPQCRA